MIDRMLPIIAKQIAPYKEVVYRALMKDKTKDPDMEKANEFVKNNDYDSALDTYLGVWKRSKNPAAGVNAGIMYEALGDLDSALATVKAVVDETANKTAMGEYNRLLREKKAQEELMKQLQ
jgi:tetratricopeptide (TPR) repeat protein